MSLAGAGGAREPLPTGPRRKLLRPPKANHGFALYCRQAIPAVRRNHSQQSKSPDLRFTAVRRSHAEGEPEPKSKPKVCAISGQGTMSLAGAGGARETLPTGNSGESCSAPPKANHGFALYCRQAIPAVRRNHSQQSKPNGLRFTADRRSHADRRTRTKQAKR